MKNTKEIKNANFHQQMKSEKIKEAAIILLLNYSNTIIYDIVANKNCNELQQRIKEINNNKIIRGFSYIAVTNKNSFVEYKREIISK